MWRNTDVLRFVGWLREYNDNVGRDRAAGFYGLDLYSLYNSIAEEYYRSMFRGRVSSWNLRDRHMADTLERLIEHFQRNGEPPKAVLWAHNSTRDCINFRAAVLLLTSPRQVYAIFNACRITAAIAH
jgi:erythromycin esterase-like protein